MKRRFFDALLAFNAVLAILLVGLMIRWIQGGRVAWAAGSLTSESLRLIELDDSPGRFAIDFGTPMVESAGEEAPDGTVRLVPDATVHCVWRAPDQLVVEPLRPLRRATAYRVHFDPDLRAADGRRLPPDVSVELRTRPPSVRGCVVQDDDPTRVPRIVLTFDMPVAVETLKRELTLRESDGDDVAFHLESVGDPSEHAFRITPAYGQVAGVPSELALHVGAGLRSTIGELSMARGFSRTVEFFEPIRLRTVRGTVNDGGDGRIELVFNRRVALPAGDTIRIEPAVPFQTARTWRGIELIGAFPSGGAVRVTLAKGFPGNGRARLDRDVQRSLRMPDLRPRIEFARRGSVLSALARPELEIECVNVPRLRITARRAYPNNVVRLAEKMRYPPSSIFAPAVREERDVAAPRNERTTVRFDLEKMLGERPRGIYRVALDAVDGRARRAVRLLQITDLGVTSRAAPDAVAVHVASLARNDPVAGATVRVLTPTNQELVSGRTRDDGTVVLPFARAGEDRVPFVVEVRKDDDTSFVEFSHYGVELAGDDLGGRPYVTDGLEAWVWTDRGVVRPGNEVRALLLVRDDASTAPAGREVRVHWIDPRGRVRSRETIELLGDGLHVARLRTTGAAPTGPWSVEVWDTERESRIGRAAFAVEAFVPDRLEASLDLPAELRLGATARIGVRAQWLEGGAAAKRPAEVRVRYDHGAFRPAGFEAFSFGREQPGAPPGLASIVETVLDEQGRVEVEVRVPAPSKEWQVLRASVVAEVTDPSGRAVRAGTETLVLRRDWQLGVHAGERGATVVVVDAAGELCSERVPVRVDLERRQWRWRYEPGASGRFRYRAEMAREVVASETVDAGGRARVEFEQDTSAGWYAVVAHAGGAVAEQTIGRAPRRPDRLRVTGPTQRIRPGTRAMVAIDAPFAGRALVTLEGTTIHAVREVEVEAGRTELELRVPAGLDVPNVHAVVTLRTAQAVRGRQAPFWIAGGTSIDLAHPARRCAVEATAPDEVPPGATVRVRVRATGARRAVVALVDEGIRRVTRHADPDPAGWLLARRRLDSRGADTGTRLIDSPRFTPEVMAGGDGVAATLKGRLAGTTSAAIETVALCAEPVSLDAMGEGRVELALPPSYEGRLRLAVVAAGSRASGATAKDVVVRGPLGVRIAMPRMLVPGDESRAILTVRNSTGRAGVVQLAIRGDRGLRVLGAPSELALRDSETKSVTLSLAAQPVTGEPRLHVTARLGGATRTASGGVRVRPAALWDVERLGIAGKEKITVEIPTGWLGGRVRGKLIVDGSPDSRLLPAARSLLRYPYGCLEQTTSRCVALLACRTLLQRTHSEGRALHVESMLATGIDRLLSMQLGSGGLAMWPGSGREYSFGTLHALDFLLWAKEAGCDVPAAPLERLVGRVERGMSQRRDVSWRCLAAELLARAGRPVAPWLDRLCEVAERPEDRARLALAYARAGGDQGAAMLADAEPEQDERELGGFLRSPLRERALLLRARLAATPDDGRIPPDVESLVRRLLRPRSLTTQESGQMLRAVADYYARYAPPRGAVHVVVRAGDRRLETEGKPLELELRDGQRVEIDASAPFYGLLELAGHRVRDATAGFTGLAIEREVVDLETGAPAEGLRRGRVYEARLVGRAARPIENLLVTDIVPGGCEIENARLTGDVIAGRRDTGHREIRDDRILIFPSRAVGGEFELRYRFRAVFAGRYKWPGTMVEALYDPGRRARARDVASIEIVE